MHTRFSSFVALVFAVALVATPLYAPTSAPRAHAQAGIGGVITGCTGLTGGISGALSSFTSSIFSGSVPSFDVSLNPKDLCLDAIARSISQTLLASMTQNIVNWVRSGFDGDPLFVTNPSFYFDGIAQDATRGVLEGLISSNAYDPFKAAVVRNVVNAHNASFRQGVGSTIGNVLVDPDRFYNEGFRYGGWDGFLAALEPQNNYFGLNYAVNQELSRQVSRQVGREAQKLEWNQGFLSIDACDTVETDFNFDTGTYETEELCTTTTPGQVVSSQLTNALNIPTNSILNADELNEILGSALDSILSSLINQGLASLTGGLGFGGGQSRGPIISLDGLNIDPATIPSGANSPDSTVRDAATTFTDTLEYLTEYQRDLELSIGGYQSAVSTYQSARACYQELLSSSFASQYQPQLDQITAGIENANEQIGRQQSELALVNSQVSRLQSIATRANAAKSQTEIASILQEYSTFAVSIPSEAQVNSFDKLAAPRASADASSLLAACDALRRPQTQVGTGSSEPAN